MVTGQLICNANYLAGFDMMQVFTEVFFNTLYIKLGNLNMEIC